MPVDLASLILDVPDFPRPGIGFKDITPLLASPAGLAAAVDGLAAAAPPADVVVGVEARGFLLAAPVAYRLGLGIVPVRKPGKLPRPVVSVDYDLEYRRDTVVATAGLVARLGASVAGVAVLAELAFLLPRARLAAAGLTSVSALVTFEAG